MVAVDAVVAQELVAAPGAAVALAEAPPPTPAAAQALAEGRQRRQGQRTPTERRQMFGAQMQSTAAAAGNTGAVTAYVPRYGRRGRKVAVVFAAAAVAAVGCARAASGEQAELLSEQAVIRVALCGKKFPIARPDAHEQEESRKEEYGFTAHSS